MVLLFLLSCWGCLPVLEIQTEKRTGTLRKTIQKDWFNNTFKKSEEWKQNPESTNKIPDWSKGTYLENDSIEIFECPLQEESVKIFMPPKKSSTSTDVQKIIDAIQLRLVIIRTDSSKMIVRKLYYIPDNQYLLAKGGNIDNVMLNKMGDDFTGLLITKNWNDKVLSCHNINNGKVESVLVKGNKNNTTARNVNELDEVIVMNRYSQTRPYDYTGWYVPYNPPSPVSNPNLPYSMPAPGGGGSGGSYNDTDASNSSIGVPPSCQSFDFKNKTGSLWQEAAVRNVHFNIVVVTPEGYHYSQIINYPTAILFGTPTNISIGNTDISPGLAATLSAKALEISMSETVRMYGNKPVTELTVRLYFEERLKHNYPLFIPGGRVNFNASTFRGMPTEYQTNLFNTGNCS